MNDDIASCASNAGDSNSNEPNSNHSHFGHSTPGERRHVAIVGGGVIGSGWAARFVLNGIDVAVFDPDPDTPRIAGEILANAERAFERLFGADRPPRGDLRFGENLADTVTSAFFVQESVPERLDLKRRILADIDAAAPPETIIASSTSGLLPSEMQRDLAHPQRLLVGHPFNPVYLLPLVELVAGRDTSPQSIEGAHRLYASIGMKPVRVAKEIDAFIGDRLQEALWREALWLVRDGIATVEEIDDVIRYSFGLRWAQMGVFQTYRIAGGEAGMRHFLEQFGPALAWPWSRLVDVPDLDETLIETIAEQSDDQAHGRSIRELERIRDNNLIAIMQGLEGGSPEGGAEDGWGAGAALGEFRKAMKAKAQGGKTP
ncbi:3-hydroxyacyl-CoA dehydrogenase NAD-binding domain-containing protein [Thioalkalivibrio sp. HK1]|uniref:3-hydroxyacyl-CoA dehydrogenase NAD-binding domain-containing protein n=1 Tax=Thioalkalivibrio sp. HK1 TaxID=1469245 RepID=UPI000471F596|nr:3-hydroxyacyl-CoA dehydrogenase NAD-binding domain-containing protein [Thioalkalivibrio sp. HK1]